MSDPELAALERAATAEPVSATAHAQLAQAYVRVGRLAEAACAADRAADLDPAHEELSLRWGEWRTYARNAARTAAAPWPLEGELGVRWQRALSACAAPVVSNGLVLVPAHDGRLHALELVTGEPRWTSTPEPGARWLTSSSVGWGGLVVVGSDERAVHALDVQTGGLVWSNHDAPSGPGLSGAAVVGDAAVLQWGDRAVALDLGTGVPRWSVPVSANHDRLPPVVRGGTVLMEGRTRAAIDLRSGRCIHSEEVSLRDADDATQTALVGGFGLAYLSSRLAGFALDMATGGTRWLDEQWENRPPGCMALMDGVLFVQSGCTVSALDAMDGEELWQAQGLDADESWGLVVSGDTVLVGCEGGRLLVGLDVRTGASRTRTPLPERGWWRPALAPGHVVLAGVHHVTALSRIGSSP